MSPNIYKTPQKAFVIRAYPDLAQIKTVLSTIARETGAKFQISVLRKIMTNGAITKKEFDKTLTHTKQQLNGVLDDPFQFGYFHNPEIGILFIAGHLTETFLNKVDDSKLASLPAGFEGIFRGLGFNVQETKNFLSELKNNQYCLIIRGENKALDIILPLLGGQ